MNPKVKQQVYRVVLGYRNGMSHSVFIKAKDRKTAEKRALRRNPDATHIDRSPHPLN
jgi:hypothetical protein